MQNFTKYLKTKANIAEPEFQLLIKKVEFRNIEKGEVLLRPGEVCRHSFFIENGLLRSYTVDDAGKEHIIQFGSENWIVSDRSSAFFNEPSDLFIDAIEDTEVVLISSDFINEASEISSSFRNYNQIALQNHIRHQQKRINLLLSASAERRYMNFIKLYPDLTLRVPQWMIASYLGITPESLSRVRKELAHKNFKPN
ncbi:CRP-like cAMP-binding protein [Arenibacter algicola]|uniref:Anaerobic regulatory protein n=1 Tax=Arenibacter algicola TaxID=616991 RepID=A0A221V169_9FLAO|nr:Crp/Fnr family transcriptional regulator [Arenibacter algicola]ASO07263.1 anaerobic regulatory protein [Arenibacter algicola]MDX1769239.1 Crp/Fnr family transcriptional regulator [Arenibacter troitsensis]HCO84025.1 Crp/Fnr family transcriptional regulator [Arenibacter sp.]|tara:strand:+ start:521 stop:1111 length:591 start_codon:yes stop_codon:yes gene_type:complete